MSNPAFAAIAARMGDELKSFRSAAVTSENRATPLARSILAAMVAGVATETTVTVAVLHSYGNPKTPKGKALTSLTASGDHLPGFGATRKTVSSILDVFANIDADKPVQPVDSDGEPIADAEPIGKGEVRNIVTAFILSTPEAPKSLRALREAVRAAIAAHVAATSPDNSEAEADADAANAEANGDAPAPAMSLVDRVNALSVAYQAADGEAKAEAHEALQALFALVNADVEAEVAELEAAE